MLPLQVVTYGEYLPKILGTRRMASLGINLGRAGYNSNVDATIVNAFAAAAFRFGHSQISFGTQPQTSSYRNASAFIELVDTFNQPMTYRAIGQEKLIRGICVEPAQRQMNEKFVPGNVTCQWRLMQSALCSMFMEL